LETEREHSSEKDEEKEYKRVSDLVSLWENELKE
jgi:hypothetical protein